jgi:hypothetical protein
LEASQFLPHKASKAMAWPGHDDAPHFEVDWLFDFGWLQTALRRIPKGVTARIVKLLVALVVLAALAALVVAQPAVKASFSKTLDRMARSAEAQGRLIPDTARLVVDKFSQLPPENTAQR